MAYELRLEVNIDVNFDDITPEQVRDNLREALELSLTQGPYLKLQAIRIIKK